MSRNGYNCPEIYGDPAVLMPIIYQPTTSKDNVKREFAVIHHHSVMNVDAFYSIPVMTDDWKPFIDEICNCKLVISSSLHGIILSEAYGIPAILLKEGDMDLLKYKDYYYSTGRHTFPIANTVNEALRITPADIPDFTHMQRILIKSFPADLWD